MEWWRALMIPTIGDSSEGNGFVAIVICDPSPGTLSSSTTKTIVIVALKVNPLYSSSKKLGTPRSYRPQNSDCRILIIFRMERSRSFALSGVTESWISSENILSFLKPLSIPMSKPRSLRVCIKSRSILGMIWLSLYRINYHHGLPQILKNG